MDDPYQNEEVVNAMKIDYWENNFSETDIDIEAQDYEGIVLADI